MESVCYKDGEGSKEAKITVRCCPDDNHDINVEMLRQRTKQPRQEIEQQTSTRGMVTLLPMGGIT